MVGVDEQASPLTRRLRWASRGNTCAADPTVLPKASASVTSDDNARRYGGAGRSSDGARGAAALHVNQLTLTKFSTAQSDSSNDATGPMTPLRWRRTSRASLKFRSPSELTAISQVSMKSVASEGAGVISPCSNHREMCCLTRARSGGDVRRWVARLQITERASATRKSSRTEMARSASSRRSNLFARSCSTSPESSRPTMTLASRTTSRVIIEGCTVRDCVPAEMNDAAGVPKVLPCHRSKHSCSGRGDHEIAVVAVESGELLHEGAQSLGYGCFVRPRVHLGRIASLVVSGGFGGSRAENGGFLNPAPQEGTMAAPRTSVRGGAPWPPLPSRGAPTSSPLSAARNPETEAPARYEETTGDKR